MLTERGEKYKCWGLLCNNQSADKDLHIILCHHASISHGLSQIVFFHPREQYAQIVEVVQVELEAQPAIVRA